MRASSRAASQLRLLTLIADHIWTHGCQPSLRELAAAMGWSSAAYVQVLLGRLKGEGTIDYDHKARAVRFDWQAYVSESALSRYERGRAGSHPRRRAVAEKCHKRRRELGPVSK